MNYMILLALRPGDDKSLKLSEVALELGCGRGRAALHLFLAGATVLGGETKKVFDVFLRLTK